MMGKRIMALRQQAGLSQAELAKRIHVSPSTIGMYEHGRRVPAITILSALSAEFGVTIDYLVSGSPTSISEFTLTVSAILQNPPMLNELLTQYCASGKLK